MDQKNYNIDDGPHRVVYVDFEPDALELKVADVTEFGAFSEYRARVLADDNECILSKIGDALAKLTQSSVFVKKQSRFDRFDFLRAIVVGGDISQPCMEELHNALVKAFPGQESKIRDNINPLYVGAVGAAARAWWFALHPEALRDDENCQGHGVNMEHNEL